MKVYPYPEEDDQIYEVFLEYSTKKGFLFTEEELKFAAEECFLTFSSQDWMSGNKPIRYWPPIAMRWLLYRAKRDNKLPTKSGPNFRKKLLGDKDE